MENPVVTLSRLIDSRLRVVKDDGGLARVLCSQANYDRELLKDYDAQITVSKSAEPCQQQKHTLDGKLRRRIYSLRVTITTIDKPSSVEASRVIRDKVLEQLLLIIPENRNLPNRTILYYYPLYDTSITHKAYNATALAEPKPSSTFWTELDNTNYPKIWASDNNRHSISAMGLSEYAFMLFRLKIASKTPETRNEPRKQSIKKVLLSFEGYGIAPSGNGVTLQVWDNASDAWSNPQTSTAVTDETLTITLTSNLTNYVNNDGYLYLIAKTTNPSDTILPAILYCDFVQALVDVRGITFCDIHNHKDIDIIDVKPFLFKEEIQIVAWLFESVATS